MIKLMELIGGKEMDTKAINYFITCYETGSINKAARELYITPQGLGRTLEKLEAELEVTLFERSRTGLIPTECGKYFYPRCKEIMNRLRNLEVEMKWIAQNQDRIRVGFSCGVMNILHIDNVEHFQHEHPSNYTDWTEGFNEEIKQKLVGGKLDVAFVVGDIDSPYIKEEKIFSRKMCAVVYEGHPLYEKDKIGMKDLKGEELITLNEKFQSYYSIVRRCQELDFVPLIKIRTMESVLIYRFAAEKRGIGIDIDIHRNDFNFPGIHIIEIEDSIPWTVNAAYHSSKENDARVRELLDYYKK